MKDIKRGFILLLVLTLLTGLLYPLGVTLIAKAFFSKQADGSLIIEEKTGRLVGSELIGQNFTDPRYLWGRLSATTPAYNAAASSGSNLGPLNPILVANAKARVDALKAMDPDNPKKIPIDLVTASGSGLDPHISPAAADYQVSRLARENHTTETEIRRILKDHTEGRTFGLLGEPRVNVLAVNLALKKAYAIP